MNTVFIYFRSSTKVVESQHNSCLNICERDEPDQLSELCRSIFPLIK